jgi:hypothetical protein
VITAPAQGINGTYFLSWSAVQGAARFVLEEAVGGGWSVVFDGAGRTYQVTSKPAGTYRYRVKACNPQGCGVCSAEAAITALYAPSVPALSVPAASYNGSYAVSVSSVAQASSYRIEEQFNGAAWTEINRISGNQLAISGRIAGSYAYRAFACNDAGCSASSAVGSIVVTLPPVQATAINLGGVSYSSTVSMWWGAIPAATSYQLMEQLNGVASDSPRKTVRPPWPEERPLAGTVGLPGAWLQCRRLRTVVRGSGRARDWSSGDPGSARAGWGGNRRGLLDLPAGSGGRDAL